jgi:hypothetical protein
MTRNIKEKDRGILMPNTSSAPCLKPLRDDDSAIQHRWLVLLWACCQIGPARNPEKAAQIQYTSLRLPNKSWFADHPADPLWTLGSMAFFGQFGYWAYWWEIRANELIQQKQAELLARRREKELQEGQAGSV